MSNTHLSRTLTVEQGVIKGEMQAKVDIARNLVDSGMSTSQVAQSTGLSEFSVNQLRG